MSLALLNRAPFVLPSSLSPVERLIATTDQTFEQGGIDPEKQAAYCAAVVSDIWEREWVDVCLQNGIDPYDRSLRREVVIAYIRRVEPRP